jgi:hypothetical protein
VVPGASIPTDQDTPLGILCAARRSGRGPGRVSMDAFCKSQVVVLVCRRRDS